MRTPPSPSALRRFARRVLTGGVALAAIASATACDLAGASSAPEAPKPGGTLYVVTQADFDNLDPQVSYVAVEADALRLLARTLTTYKATPDGASEIVGDLATDAGRPSDNNTVWRFTLKPGLRWEDGSPVTCSQVRYGVERRFSRDVQMQGGAPYPLQYLQDNSPDPYLGPWVANDNNRKGLESIKCLDERRIEFHLSKPVGDFGYAVAMSTFAPVPPEKDTREEYTRYPFSNGPYKIEPGSHTDKGMVLVRNPFWDPKTDQVRKAYPDKIVFQFREDASGSITNELIEDEGDSKNTIMLDVNVAPNFLQQVVNDPDLLKRAVTGTTGAVRFLAINTERITSQACREALIHAFNKRKFRAVYGGSALGDYATTMIPPGFGAYKKFDVFDSVTHPEGDPDRALTILEEQEKAKTPCPSKVSLAFPDSALRRRLMNTVVEAYQRVGIEIDLKPLSPKTYYNNDIGDPANPYDMMWAGWVPDWGNGSAIIPPLYDGRLIPPLDPITGHGQGSVNFSNLRDKSINDQIDGALAETSPERQWALWGDLDLQIQQKAVGIPILYEKGIRMAGSNVRGGFLNPFLGMPDLCALGLAQP
ncbi:MAG: ABC transporter substrate-binding protein [Micromonosporaceae bacterium]